MNIIKLYFIAIIVFLFTIYDGTVFAKTTNIRPLVMGRVVAVLRDGYMVVNPSGSTDGETISIRLWGYTVASQALALATLGREIRCTIVYQTSVYVVDSCLVTFIVNEDAVSAENLLLQEFGMGVAPLISTLDILGLGEYGCSEEDWEQLPENGTSRYRDQCDLWQ